MIQLTPEQNAIVNCNLSPGEALKIIAFAGTGKTSTLIAYAKARPHMRFLYVAFNKSVQLEAAAKFPENVVSRTSHALAFHTHGYKHRDRIVPGFKANAVMDALHLNNYEDARFTMDTLHNYLISADPKVTKRHVPYPAIAFYEQQKKTPPDLITWANRLGRLMCDGSDENIGMLHDGYLKLYQLSSPVLNFDCILLDEAQDINPVTRAFVLSQTNPHGTRSPASMIIVGDSHQQIYSFRGATDTLKKIKTAKTLYLTQSFRFNSNIATVANMILQTFKHEKNRIVGRPFNRSAKPVWQPKGYSLIARTNAGVFDQAARLFKNNKLGFIGGVQGYRLNIIKDVYRLYRGTREHIFDNTIKRFTTYTDLKSYAAAVEDIELLSVCKLVENYKARIPGLVNRINEKAVETGKADIILTTAHKSKGLEWDNVLIMDDFPDLVENDAPIDPTGLEPDEFNLIYVAITRAIHNLRFQRGSSVSAFIKMMQGKGRRAEKGLRAKD